MKDKHIVSLLSTGFGKRLIYQLVLLVVGSIAIHTSQCCVKAKGFLRGFSVWSAQSKHKWQWAVGYPERSAFGLTCMVKYTPCAEKRMGNIRKWG